MGKAWWVSAQRTLCLGGRRRGPGCFWNHHIFVIISSLHHHRHHHHHIVSLSSFLGQSTQAEVGIYTSYSAWSFGPWQQDLSKEKILIIFCLLEAFRAQALGEVSLSATLKWDSCCFPISFPLMLLIVLTLMPISSYPIMPISSYPISSCPHDIGHLSVMVSTRGRRAMLLWSSRSRWSHWEIDKNFTWGWWWWWWWNNDEDEIMMTMMMTIMIKMMRISNMAFVQLPSVNQVSVVQSGSERFVNTDWRRWVCYW